MGMTACDLSEKLGCLEDRFCPDPTAVVSHQILETCEKLLRTRENLLERSCDKDSYLV